MKNLYPFFNELKQEGGAIWLDNQQLKLSVPKILQHQETKKIIQRHTEELTLILNENAVFSLQDFQRKLIFKDCISQTFPLSSAQQRLWFVEKYEEGSSAYHIPQLFELNEHTSIKGIKIALQALVKRHEILRTTIEENQEGEEPIQIVHSDSFIINEHEVEDRLCDLYIKDIINVPFDLKNDYPFRAHLLTILPTQKSTPKKRILVLNTHHIASDGWSSEVFKRDFFAIYQNVISSENKISLPILPIQYKDYAVWQRNQSSKDISHQLEFWKEKMLEYETLEFPIDKLRPQEVDYKGKQEYFSLSRETSEKVRSLAKEYRVSLHSMLLSCFNILLSKYTRQNEIVTGSPIANRHHQETQNLIGFFVNTQVNRTILEESQTFQEVVQQVHAEQIAAQRHQDLPFDKLIDELNVVRDSSRHPIFQIMFEVLRFEEEEDQLYSQVLTPYQRQENDEAEKFDMTFKLMDSKNGIKGGVSYAVSLFQEETISRFISHFQYLVDQLLSQPTITCQEISLVSSDEYQELVVGLNQLDENVIVHDTIHKIVEQQAEKSPDKVALVFGEQSITYKEVNEKSNQLANKIRKEYQKHTGKELVADTLVALCLDRGIETVIGILGILKAGGAYVPIDPTYPQDRIDYLIQDTNVDLILTQRYVLEGGQVKLPVSKCVSIDIDEAFYKVESKDNLMSISGPNNLAYVIYTSGTTGQPKGAMIEHQNVVRLFNSTEEQFGFNEKDVWTLFHSYVFDFSVWELWGALFYGGKLIVITKEQAKDTTTFIDVCQQQKVTVLNQTPSAFYRFADLLKWQNTQDLSLRYIVFGGEAINVQQLQSWWDFQHTTQLNTKLINMYGITETTVHVTFKELDQKETCTSNIGKPIKDLQTYIVDNQLTPVPYGVIGELYIGGAGLARGYWNRDKLTAERFITNPFLDEEKGKNENRLYKTGDLVKRLANGDLEYVGRNDDQIKIRGYRIELHEVEQAVLQITEIKQCCVIVNEFKNEQSETHKRLVAYCILDLKETSLEADVIKSKLTALLPEYMVPEAIVIMDEFPLTINGKLNKKALPEVNYNNRNTTYIAPVTEDEEKCCTIWQDVLAVEKVGLTDDFFNIGGNSILAVQVSHQLSKALQCTVKVADVFRYKSIREILLHNKREQQSLIPALVEKSQPLSFAQERLWFIEKYEEGTTAFHIPVVFAVEEDAHLVAIQKAFQKIVSRHEVLRTIIREEGNEPCQIVQEEGFQVETAIIHSEAEYKAQLKEDINQHFDLSTEYPIRVKLYNLEACEETEYKHMLLMNMHHIASDAWSMEVFKKEFIHYYKKYSQDENQVELSTLSIQYKDFSAWQKAYLTVEVLETQLNYWKAKLEGFQSLQLPTDFARPVTMDYEGDAVSFALSRTLSDKIRGLAKNTQSTLTSVMLSSVNILLSKYTGQNDIVLGSAIANRHYQQTEDLIGFFVNTQAYRTVLNDTQSFLDLIHQTQQDQVDAQQYQDLPFERLVDELKVERDTSKHPVYQVMFEVITDTINKSANEDHPHFKLMQVDDDYHVEKIDLSIVVSNKEEAMMGKISYATSLFQRETIERLVDSYVYLLEQLVEKPQQAYCQHSLLLPDAYHEIVHVLNQTDKEFSHHKTIHQLVEEQAERTPDTLAIVCEGRKATYRELNEKSNQLARCIRKQYQVSTNQSLSPDTLITLCLDRSIEMVIGILAVMKAGGAYVPIDPDYPTERISFILEDTGAQLMLTKHEVLAHNNLDTVIPFVLNIDLEESIYQQEEVGNLQPISQSTDLAYIIYTSGTTGKPKGVLLEHRGVVNLIENQIREFDIAPHDNLIQFASYVFDASVSEIFTAITVGATLHIVTSEVKQSPDKLNELIRKEEIHVATIPPSLLSVMEYEAFPSLKTLVVAGESCPEKYMKKWAVGRKLINAYGPTENSVCATMHTYQVGDRNTNIGEPINNCKVYILNGNMEPVPVGVVGEIYLGGAGLARGYFKNTLLTQQKFVPNPFATNNEVEKGYTKLYKTGDVAKRLPEGGLDYVGRNDEQVKVRGHRIELAEIENVLQEHHEIGQASVMLKNLSNGPNKKLVAYYAEKAKKNNKQSIAWWPSIAEYYVYDDLLYSLMTTHEKRNECYRQAIREKVKGKIVLDIGTGPDVILSRICVEEGAKKVYAIEYLAATHKKARQTIKNHGLEGKIQLFHGDCREVELPEKVDFIVSELVGAIGGSEGVAVLLNDAKERHLKPEGKFIPEISLTKMALVEIPEHLMQKPVMHEAPNEYTKQIFSQIGYPFDLRVCLKGVDYSNLVSSVDTFEDLDWTKPGLIPINHTHTIEMEITRNAVSYGCLVWLDLICAPGYNIDILEDQHSWIPVFIPVFPNGIHLQKGDRIVGTVERVLCENQFNFDYIVKGEVLQEGKKTAFYYNSIHLSADPLNNAFYHRFFDVFNQYDKYSIERIEEYTASSLPSYMVPDVFVEVDTFPLTVNGKIDKKALPSPDFSEKEGAYVAPRSTIEIAIAHIWEELLGINKISVNDNFFKIGGDSILSMQVSSRIRQAGYNCQVKEVFEYKTIANLAKHLISKGFKTIEKEKLVVNGEYDILPTQEWFFDNVKNGHFQSLNHWNQSFLLQIPEIAITRLQDIIKTVFLNHDVFRSRFKKKVNTTTKVEEWKQEYHTEAIVPEVSVLDISSLSEEEVQQVLTKWQSDFDIEEGSLSHVGYLHGYADGSARIMMAFHHLIIDAVSWRILTEEIKALFDGHNIPDESISFVEWGDALKQYTVVHESEEKYWESQLKEIPVYEGKSDKHSECIIEFDQEFTEELLKKAVKAYHSEINDLFLTSLAYVLKNINQSNCQSVTMEGHGREDIDASLDTSNVVGWFTSIYPVKLEVLEQVGKSICQVKEALRKVPSKGVGFGAFVSKSTSSISWSQLPPVSFNYLGQFETQKGDDWQIISEASGNSIHQSNSDQNVISINGMISGGRLGFSISTKLGDQKTKQLANDFKKQLENISKHCIYKLNKYGSEYTPSDFFEVEHEGDLAHLPILLNKDKVSQPFEMTEIQKAYLLGRMDTFEIGGVSNHAYYEFQYQDQLDIPKLERVIKKIIINYPELRAVFDAESLQQKYKMVEDVGDYHIKLEQIDHKYDEGSVQTTRDHLSHFVYDAGTYPMFTFQVSRFSDCDILHVSFDLILLDAESRQTFFNTIDRLYSNEKETIVSNNLNFKDYQDYVSMFKHTKWYTKDKAYWLKKVQELPLRPVFKMNNDPKSIEKPKFGISNRYVEQETWAQFKQKASEAGISTSAALLSLYGYVLSRYSMTKDFLITLTVFNRYSIHPEVNQIWGDFTSTNLFGYENVKGNIIDKLKTTHDNLWDDLSHGMFNGAEVQRELQSHHGLNPFEAVSPIVFTGRVGGDTAEEEEKKNPYFLESFENPEERVLMGQTSQAWIDLQAVEVDNKFFSGWLYVEQLFDKAHIDLLNEEYCSLIEYLANADWTSDMPAVQLMASDREIVEKANDFHQPKPSATLVDICKVQIWETPDNIAVIDSLGQYTYAQLGRGSSGIAKYLTEHSLCEKNKLIAVLSEKGYQQVLGTLGVMRSGAAYLPLHIDWPLGRVESILEEGLVQTVLVSKSVFCSKIQNSEVEEKYNWLIVEEIAEYESTTDTVIRLPTSEDIAYVIFTSGSTGKPKGVIINHSGAVNTILAVNKRFRVGEDDKVLALSELSFDLSVYDIFGLLAAGGTIVFPEQTKTKEPEHWYDLIQQHEVTLWDTVPQLMQLLVDHVKEKEDPIPSLKTVLMSGDWIPVKLPETIKSLNSNTTVMSLGGATEGSIWSIWYEIEKVEENWSSIPYGQAMPNQKMYVLNEFGEHCPEGVVGDIYIGGDGVALGYWQDENKSRAAFMEHSTLGRIYKTGDLGKWNKHAYIEFEGRIDSQVKINGYRVELGEIENVLLQLPTIKQAYVTVKEKVVSNKTNKYLVGYCIVENGSVELNSTSIQNQLLEFLPIYMIPSVLVQVDSFPLTSNGKLNTKALPEPDFTPSAARYVAPTSDLHKAVCEIWQEELGVEKIGITDDFFMIGGNSILAMRVAHHIKKALKLDVKVADVYKYNNVDDLVSNTSMLQLDEENIEMTF